MQIRRATVDDILVIANLWAELIDFHSDREPFFSRTPDGKEYYAGLVLSWLNSPAWLVLVAVSDDNTIIGYCSATISQYAPLFKVKRYGYVEDVAVTADYRGQGIGRQLYDRVEDWFRDQGITHVELRVAITNEMSQAFWRRQGFGHHMIRLAKDL